MKESCRLAYLLRHDKTYTFEAGGWRSVENLVQEHGFTFKQLCDLVDNDSKGRFEFNEERTKIRALYGHSVKIEPDMPGRIPPDILYHGTSVDADASIRANGIMPRSRNFVHLTSDEDSALQTGSRHGSPEILCVDALGMHNEGYRFYNPAENTWLVNEVPPRFIQDFACSFTPNEVKMIRLVCDSDEIASCLKEDKTVMSLCEIVRLSDISLSEDAPECELLMQEHIFVIFDESGCDSNFINAVRKFGEHVSDTILISPKKVEGVPFIQADDVGGICRLLHALCAMIEFNPPMPIDLNDIRTLLLKEKGEIKFLSYEIESPADFISVSEDLFRLLNGQSACFKASVIHVATPEDCAEVNQVMDGIQEIRNAILASMPGSDCLVGCSAGKHNKEIRLSLFLH